MRHTHSTTHQEQEATFASRRKMESDIVNQVRNEIEEILLMHAPTTWSDERLEAIEETVLDSTKMILAGLSTDKLQSPGAMRTYIAEAVADTKRRIRNGRAERNGGAK